MISQKKTEEHPFADIFDEDETEKDFLLSKPVCFIIFGKPGAGKTTLANQIAQTWKCVRVEALPVLEEMIATESESGAMLRSMLISGNSVPDELVTKLMLEKLNSSEVSHFGYIVTEIPSLSEDAMTVLQQVELIKNLKLKPDIIINIRCPDYDLCQRISGQRQHCNTGYVYTRDQWDPEVIESHRKKKKDTHKEGKTEEEGEEEEEQEEEEAFIAEMQMAAEILHHLVQRPEDYLENVENIIQLYKETILNCLEEVMAEHNPQFLIELDGNKPPEELFMDELFRTLSAYKLIAPRYRWRRSKWGRTCPVALKEGNIYSGLPDFSVSFLGKIYCLSSEETLKSFLLNPRPFLLPPMPIPPCKIFIFGPQYSGKTTLSHLIANYYKGKVIDYTTVVQPIFDAARESLIENSIAEATEAAIKVVKENLLAELQAKRQDEKEINGTSSEQRHSQDPIKNQNLNLDSEIDAIYHDPDEELEGEDYDVHEESEVPENRPSLVPEDLEMPETEHKLASEPSEDTTTGTEITKESKEIMESKESETEPFQYSAWELTIEDYDEETEDYQAEADIDEDLDEEEEEEEESEERIKEKRRHLGDTKSFCPVVLKENFILQPCSTEEAAKYREKFYYFSSAEAREKFQENPEDYVAHSEPLKAPPPRICLMGPRGSGKTVCGRHVAEKFGIFHIQFEEVLQEKLLLKTERKFGPEYEEDSDEEQVAKQELEELAAQANVKIEDENAKTQPPEVQLTEEEEIIKSSLVESEPLPPEILEVILSEWWLKEPFRSTGFILDGFPRYPEEALFLGDHGFFPDTAVFIQVDDQDIFDRLLPSKVEKWKQKQKKKLERKKLIKDMKTKIRDDNIAKRRAELIAEKDKRKKAEGGFREDEEVSEEEPDDDEDDIENILEEEFPKDEEEMSEEDEEQEIDAIDRLRSELGEKFETEMSNLQMIQDEFEKFLIPMIHINGARKIHIVQYILHTKLKPLVENRESIFEKCYPISTQLAQKMLTFTYKYISSFGYWDPVKLYEGEIFKPVENAENPLYPVIHRQYIYFLSSKETKDKFMKNPIKYIRQPKPKLTVPIRIVIVGPPKSGKTTVAKKLASDYGLKHLSIGDALRTILNNHAETELGLMLNWHLHKGMVAPDELAIQALDLALMDSVCNTSGVVIDGYPVTAYQMNLLETNSIIPMIIFELDVPSKEIFKRLFLEKKSEQNLPYPLHNSAQIIAIKNAKYRKNIGEIRQYYQEQHQNWYVIDGLHSKWWVWNEVTKKIYMINKHMQTYLERIREGKAALINKLCITPQELISRLGEFGQFCPVSLAESYELCDCSVTDSLEFAAEFRGHYYKMSSQEKLNKFLENPELYVTPLAPHPLPPADRIPKRLTLSELKSRFPKCAELQGYCPVTYQDGKQRYEALVPGNINYAVEYRDRIYICESKEKLDKFLR
ncbi:hypothetical protein GHT09_005548 [Marmota monax]|uniref:Adenylate kinase 9 n=1 Tax=Marmota monax TaxID=9995 RepID=A0A834QRR8_MARMO|nr:hypothetical protein GHT09_005548 [Marmota monax]